MNPEEALRDLEEAQDLHDNNKRTFLKRFPLYMFAGFAGATTTNVAKDYAIYSEGLASGANTLLAYGIGAAAVVSSVVLSIRESTNYLSSRTALDHASDEYRYCLSEEEQRWPD